jgi:hypothetical protein
LEDRSEEKVWIALSRRFDPALDSPLCVCKMRGLGSDLVFANEIFNS